MKSSQQRYLIVGRGLQVRHPKTKGIVFFDYAAVPYPQGLAGPQVMYLNHSDISSIVHKGYSDKEDKAVVDSINQFLESHPETMHAK